MNCQLLNLLRCSIQISAEVLVEVAIHSWQNPLKIGRYSECCDDGASVPPKCTDECDTRFDFCLQPAQFSAANTNCPFGRYRSPASDFISDPDNQSFVFGINLEGHVPNPMPFHLASYPKVSQSSEIPQIGKSRR